MCFLRLSAHSGNLYFQFIGCFNTKFHVLSLDIVFQFLAFESCTKCDEEFEASLWCVEFFNKHNASFLEFDPASFIGVDRFGDTVEAAGTSTTGTPFSISFVISLAANGGRFPAPSAR